MRRKILTVMIKPAGGACNLNCTYCFYKDEENNRSVGCRGVMGLETARALIEKSSAVSEAVLFLFQGGEPTLAGLDFFKGFLDIEKEYPGTRFYHSLQSNGINIDDRWADFFKDNHFLVGISLDGGPALNNIYRLDGNGNPTSKYVNSATRILERHQVEFNILAVVTAELADNANYCWNFLVGHNYMHQQYIPCMDPIGSDGSEPYHLTSEAYGAFLCRLFDLWYESMANETYVSVRTFENFMDMVMGYKAESCDMCGRCNISYVVESDGDVYPCDFYCLDRYYLGNIAKDDFTALDEKRRATGFIEESKILPSDCRSCPAYVICRGGCRRYRDAGGRYRFCGAMKTFYGYAGDRMTELGRKVKDSMHMSFSAYIARYSNK